jgi:hypothetical protein
MSNYMFGKHTLASAALLCAGLPALAANEASSAAAVAPLPQASIKCSGISSVPMTADAEQVLPMRLVATLGCNEPVVILADDEGYTSLIRRAADGKEGFVARMYLNLNASASSAPVDLPLTSASPVNNVVRWQTGAPGCDTFAAKGYIVESATANGITIQVSLQDTGWKLRATIAISNATGETIEVLPTLVTLDELQPTLKSLSSQDVTKLAHVVNHQVLLTQSNAQPPASAHFAEAHVTNASYRTTAPNYFTEHKVPTTSSNNDANAFAGSGLTALALKPGKLASGQKTTGAIWFQRDANARELSLRVLVGNLIFDFPLSFNQKR